MGRQSFVTKMFDEISPTYDSINKVLSLGQDQKWRKFVTKHLPLKPHLEILDLATGTGDQIFSFFQSPAIIQRIVGIDLSEEMLKIGRKKILKTPFEKKIQFLQADAQKLPFKNEEFDAITFSFGIRNVENPMQALHEIFRVLKPNGKCLILEFSMPNRFVRPFYLLYLRKILPFLGGILSKNFAAYRYLNQTIESFPTGDQFLSLMKSANFAHLQKISMNFGTVTLYVGEK